MPSLRIGGGGTTTETVVAGTNRYKYFKRPIMPRVNAYPPHFLLAPSAAGENNPLEPNLPPPEEPTREMGIQTMYRDSESQTNPYTPAYVVPAGQEPEVLLLKNLTYEDGLPMGDKEMAMIEFARAKREMEMNLPPFTDEASLTLRKRLMESQEMREFRIRESEIDKIREEKIQKLQEAIQDREESNEHMTTQRLESVRLLRMEEREKVLEKIRTKRIKALRRLAHQRNVSDPILSESASNGQSSTKMDIIDAYFDRGSQMYAPLKREGKESASKQDNYDIQSRTAPLDNLGNLLALEYTIPRNLLAGGPQNFTPVLASQTMPSHMIRELQNGGGDNQGYRHRNSKIKAAEPRMTSATARAYRQTKRDVEEMHQILTQKKRGGVAPTTPGRNLLSASAPAENIRPFSPPDGKSVGAPNTGSPVKTVNSTLLSKKPKVRPPTPDITRDRPDDHEQDNHAQRRGHHHHHHHQAHHMQLAQQVSVNEQQYLEALVLLQRLIRGRAVQNIMFEGKYRRRELIAELQAADAADREQAAWQAEAELAAANAVGVTSTSANAVLDEQQDAKARHEDTIRITSLDAVGGAVSTQIAVTLAIEKKRVDMIEKLQAMASRAIIERRDLEAAEAGRRQRQGMEYPTHTADGLPIDKTALSTLVISPLPNRNIAVSVNPADNGIGSEEIKETIDAPDITSDSNLVEAEAIAPSNENSGKEA